MTNITEIRRRVATMANRLKKMGLTLSAAFKRAWRLIKGKAIDTKVAGVTKGNRQRALRRILTAYRPEQVSVKLERDRANLHDNNAVKVLVSVNGSEDYHMGYIPRNLAYVAAALMDKGLNLAASFKAVRGHYAPYMNYGAVITLQLA